ncbi:hypothetical protein [Nonomuraea composti]|uniref:hypothetical protein n=1 Tax=Nonomuraea composti TaxID=2720023 RepID=UPI00197E7C78|nr:hypothetical protein [Nonomuraea sp. FMUSA5-5]
MFGSGTSSRRPDGGFAVAVHQLPHPRLLIEISCIAPPAAKEPAMMPPFNLQNWIDERTCPHCGAEHPGKDWPDELRPVAR